jgi:hypothetical protein
MERQQHSEAIQDRVATVLAALQCCEGEVRAAL